MNTACLLPGPSWGSNIDVILLLSERRKALLGHQLQQEEDITHRSEWFAPSAETQKLNDVIEYGEKTYKLLEPLEPTAVAEHEKQQEEIRRGLNRSSRAEGSQRPW